MKLTTLVKLALGSGVGLAALMVAPTAASAATVPCTQDARAAAINAANNAGGGVINLASGCDYALTSADNGENGLPAVITQIGVNGNGATIDGTGAVRVFEVDGPGGTLSAQNVTITGGAAFLRGGDFNKRGTGAFDDTTGGGHTPPHAAGGAGRSHLPTPPRPP